MLETKLKTDEFRGFDLGYEIKSELSFLRSEPKIRDPDYLAIYNRGPSDLSGSSSSPKAVIPDPKELN